MNYKERREIDGQINLEIFGKNVIPCTHLFCACPTVPHYSWDLNEAWKIVELLTTAGTETAVAFMLLFNRSGLWAMSQREAAQWICEAGLEVARACKAAD